MQEQCQSSQGTREALGVRTLLPDQQPMHGLATSVLGRLSHHLNVLRVQLHLCATQVGVHIVGERGCSIQTMLHIQQFVRLSSQNETNTQHGNRNRNTQVDSE